MKQCGALTRAGRPCRSPAMANGRCRMHGGTSPGAPKGNRNAWKHGLYSAETVRLRALLRALRQELPDTQGR
ncbi:MAG: HGGxSTG domain-containing protein [Polymorphobacter sp.]|uniref:HGGxSTG domain-containing protein n=1 Tax=Polymorphobacter sp. TaxID=1909290 RepID=UPI003A882A4E